MTTGTTNIQHQNLLNSLEEHARDSKLWKRVASDLKKPSRQRREVNIYKIEKYAKDGETILIPGKVLSLGEMHRNIDVAAFNFSAGAKKKIIDAKGQVLSITELLEKNPEGKNVRILG